MVAIEPVKYSVTRIARPPLRVGGRETRTNTGPGYFFNKLIVESEKYEELTIRNTIFQNLKETIQTENKRVSEAIAEIIPDPEIGKNLTVPVEPIVDSMREMTYAQLSNRPRLYIRTSPPKLLVMRLGATSFAVIAKQRSEAETVIAELRNAFTSIGEITSDFGLTGEEFLTGKELSMSVLKSRKDIQTIKEQTPKNDFEREAQANISTFTNATIPNASIEFTSPAESFEYDTIMTLGDSLTIDIELKDYEVVRDELHASSTDSWKNRIILAISDKARRLGATPMIVVRGFPDETFKSVKELGDSRKIDLMSADGYQQALPNLICSRLTGSAINNNERYFIPQGVFGSGATFEIEP